MWPDRSGFATDPRISERNRPENGGTVPELLRIAEGAMQKVVIVNGTTELLDLVQPVLTAGRYDVVFVESNAHAYSHIKRERPALIILCLDMHQREGFQVLSMLKLDDDTRSIP